MNTQIEAMEVLMETMVAMRSDGYTIQEAMVDMTRDIEDNVMKVVPLNMIEVKEGRYGRGVFATEDIPAGVVLTLYPVHIHLTPDGKGQASVIAQKGEEYDEKYCLTIKSGKEIIYGNKDKQHPALLGHLFNDFCPFTEEFNTTKDIGGLVLKYILYAKQYQQAQFKFFKNMVGIETTKEIKKGEEIFIAYSPIYWMDTTPKEFSDMMAKYLLSQPEGKKQFIAKLLSEYLSGK